MSTISQKQAKSQGLIDPIFILAVLVVILTVLIFAPSNNLYNSVQSTLGSFGNTSAGLSANSVVSFAADQQYWEANCSHSWSSDATCDVIVKRSQSCGSSVNSAYCSAYDKYLKKFTK
jgi:hypothetical protein